MARRGADIIQSAKQNVLDAVKDANDAGYVVGEDLSVASSRGGMAARAQAQMHAARIQQRAVELAVHDKEIASKISSATAPLTQIKFAESPDPSPSETTDPSPSETPASSRTAQDIRDAIKDLPHGANPNVRRVRDEDQLRQFWDWVSQGAKDYTSENPYRGGKGIERELPDGTIVRIGESAKSGTTMDITLPDGSHVKLHVDPERGGDLEFPNLDSGGGDFSFGGDENSSSAGGDFSFGGDENSNSAGGDFSFGGDESHPPSTGSGGQS